MNDRDLDLVERIQTAIAASGESLYAIARKSGVSYPVLHRFVTGKRGVTLDTAAQLAKALGLELVEQQKRPERPSGLMPKTIRDLANRLLHGAYDGAVDQLVAGAFSSRPPTEDELAALEKMIAQLRADKEKLDRKPSAKGKSR